MKFNRARTHIYDLKVHLILVTTYRRKIFDGDCLTTLERLARRALLKHRVDVIEMNGEEDHVHLLLSYPANLSISKMVSIIKQFTGYHLIRHHPEIMQPAWRKQHLWSSSYFAVSVGGAPLEILKQYIQQQDRPH